MILIFHYTILYYLYKPYIYKIATSDQERIMKSRERERNTIVQIMSVRSIISLLRIKTKSDLEEESIEEV